MLDIDGVLNVIPQGHDNYGGIFHKHLVENLKRIVDETGAKIVVSSTWRLNGIISIQNMWRDRGLPGEVIGITPSFWISADDSIPQYKKDKRGYEIQDWIDKNNPDNYVILDDDVDMLEGQMDNFVQTSENPDHEDCIDIGYGLTSICADKAIEILKK